MNLDTNDSIYYSEDDGEDGDMNTKYRNSEYTNTEYRNSEVYADIIQEVLGVNLSPGQTLIPFTMRLPANIPSSFYGDYGCVRYTVRASIMDRHGAVCHYQVERAIMINGILELNTNNAARDTESSGSVGWKDGVLSATLKVNKTSYINGDVICFSSSVENKKINNLGIVYISLVEIATYRTLHAEKKLNREILRLYYDSRILAETTDTWEGTLILPILPPTALGGNCVIIEISYQLELTLDPVGSAPPLMVKLPIIIGTKYMEESAPSSNVNGR